MIPVALTSPNPCIISSLHSSSPTHSTALSVVFRDFTRELSISTSSITEPRRTLAIWIERGRISNWVCKSTPFCTVSIARPYTVVTSSVTGKTCISISPIVSAERRLISKIIL